MKKRFTCLIDLPCEWMINQGFSQLEIKHFTNVVKKILNDYKTKISYSNSNNDCFLKRYEQCYDNYEKSREDLKNFLKEDPELSALLKMQYSESNYSDQFIYNLLSIDRWFTEKDHVKLTIEKKRKN